MANICHAVTKIPQRAGPQEVSIEDSHINKKLTHCPHADFSRALQGIRHLHVGRVSFRAKWTVDTTKIPATKASGKDWHDLVDAGYLDVDWRDVEFPVGSLEFPRALRRGEAKARA